MSAGSVIEPKSRVALRLFQQSSHTTTQSRWREKPEDAVAYDAVSIDQKRCGQTRDSAESSTQVIVCHRNRIGYSVFVEVLASGARCRVAGEPQDDQTLVGVPLVLSLKGRHLQSAGQAPAGPEVDDNDFSAKLSGPYRLAPQGHHLEIWRSADDRAHARPRRDLGPQPVSRVEEHSNHEGAFGPAKPVAAGEFLEAEPT